MVFSVGWVVDEECGRVWDGVFLVGMVRWIERRAREWSCVEGLRSSDITIIVMRVCPHSWVRGSRMVHRVVDYVALGVQG